MFTIILENIPFHIVSFIIHVWNSLPNEVIEANSTNSFKNRLDKHWYNEDIKYDWITELSGTGSCS